MFSKLIKILLFFYVICCISAYSVQKHFIFNAEQIPEDYNYGYGKEYEIPLSDNITMNALMVPANHEQKERKALLYLHGNRGSIRFGKYQIRTMQNLGYDILIPDYRSYGKSEGDIKNQEQLLADVQKAYNFLKEQYDESNIAIVGYSLGTGMASYLASRNEPGQLFLVAPFTSLTAIKDQYLWFLPDFLLKFPLPVKVYLEGVKCPVHIIHGTEDKIVSYNFAKELFELFPEKVKLYTAYGIGHRRIIFDPLLREVLSRELALN